MQDKTIVNGVSIGFEDADNPASNPDEKLANLFANTTDDAGAYAPADNAHVAHGIARLKACTPVFKLLIDLQIDLGDNLLRETANALFEKIDQEASDLMAHLGINTFETPWAEAQIKQIVSEHVAYLYQEKGSMSLNMSLLPYFDLSMAENIEARLPEYWQQADARVSLANSMLKSALGLGVAYDRNHLFHKDREAILQWSNELVWDGAKKAVDIIQQEFSALPESNEVILTQAMIKQASAVLVSVWEQHSATVEDSISALPLLERKNIADNGYPLETLSLRFKHRLDAVIDLSVDCISRVKNETTCDLSIGY